jgi:hypothetical protein
MEPWDSTMNASERCKHEILPCMQSRDEKRDSLMNSNQTMETWDSTKYAIKRCKHEIEWSMQSNDANMR